MPSTLVVNFLAVSLFIGGSFISASPVEAKGSAQSKMDLAELMFFNGNIDGAIRAYKQALAMEPELTQCHMG
ncbi:MAG: tetratricopeptide repeat protein, partial [Candidatus Obscuribacterales bacterium]|nr:tetratricopeptide repeat protein [Candidatus Obscuribacterales bacterium]